MDGDIDVYKHFAWLKRVSDWLLYLGLPGDEGKRDAGGGSGGGAFVRQSPVVAKFSMRI